MPSEQHAPEWRVEVGDARQLLPKWAKQKRTFAACLTGPPGCGSGALAPVNDIVRYVRAMVAIGEHLRTLLRPPGYWWLLQGAQHTIIPCSVERALQDAGWSVLCAGGFRQAVNRSHDFVTLLSAAPATDGWAERDIAGNPCLCLPPLELPGFRFPVLPPMLIRACLCLLALKVGDVILDPFCGSAQVGVVARDCGLSFVGIEVDERTAHLADQRLVAAASVDAQGAE